LSIFVYMMNTKNIYICRFTSIANNFSMKMNRLRKPFYHVCFVCFQSFMEKIGAFFGAKHFFFGLEIYSSNNRIFTNLTFASLNTGFRAVFTIFSVISCLIWFFTSFANFIISNFFIRIPSTVRRAIKFTYSFASIFSRKFAITTQTFIHKLPQVKGALCH